MKKIIFAILSLALAAALFAGCSNNTVPGDKATEVPKATDEAVATDAPAATDVPATEVPATNAPTDPPEPTAEPFEDPYVMEIIDWDDADTKNYSFDTIKINGKVMADGTVSTYRLEIEDTVDGSDGSVKTVTMRGWAGLLEEEIEYAGYQIDDGELVISESFFEYTQPEVKAAGGEFAQRFSVDIPVEDLYGEHELKIILQTAENCYYMNPSAAPFVLTYIGKPFVDNVLDGVVNAGEYSAKYVLDATNAKSWTNTDIGDRSIEYHLMLKNDGLYVGCVVKGGANGDMIQLNFNPGARLDDYTGLFISFKLDNGKITVLQHNHKNALKDDDNAGGADITSLVETAYAQGDGEIVFEVKLPIELFKVTDAGNADQFNISKERLYYGMFAVMGGGGYTNQSITPGSSWLCKDLYIHEYFVAK